MLTAKKVERTKAPGRHPCGLVKGLYLQITDSGAKSWVLRYQLRGREHMMGLGSAADFDILIGEGDPETEVVGVGRVSFGHGERDLELFPIRAGGGSVRDGLRVWRIVALQHEAGKAPAVGRGDGTHPEGDGDNIVLPCRERGEAARADIPGIGACRHGPRL